MGSKLESNKAKVENAAEVQSQALEKSKDDVRQVSEVKSILESMPDLLDEDIVAAIEGDRQATKQEGADHMNSEVHGNLEQGYDIANEAIEEAQELSQTSNQAADNFRRASGVTEFGRSTADASASTSEGIAQEFDSNAESAAQTEQESEQEFQSDLNELLS